MAKYTQEQEDGFLEHLKSILITEPMLSSTELQEKLKEEFNIELGVVYINKLRNLHFKESVKDLDEETAKAAIVEYKRIIDYIVEQLKDVATDAEKDSDKVAAWRTIIDAYKGAFNLKFDAGIFAKKLGDLNINDRRPEQTKQQIERVIAELRKAGHDIGS